MAKESCLSNRNDNGIQQPEITTTFIITGFGPFHDVDSNPTTKIIENLQNNPSLMQSLSPGIKVAKFLIFETSAAAVKHDLDKLLADFQNNNLNDITSSNTTTTNHKLVILHLGVATMHKNFRLEQKAYNEATFRIPDERGYCPCGEVVCEDLNLCECLETSLDVKMLRDKMIGEGDIEANDVIISDNPGRFVCNYTYCYSLAKFSTAASSIFLHVPPFEVIDIEKQIRFIIILMNQIHQLVSS